VVKKSGTFPWLSQVFLSGRAYAEFATLTALGKNEDILEIRRAQPDFGRNYTVVYKVYLATLDATGTNPTNKRCVVVGIPISNIESGRLQPDRSYDSVQDL
jgi:hypothetical protein